MTSQPVSVGSLLRDWRQRRRLSQLDLSNEAVVSARHLSFVETGRSRPSPELVVATPPGCGCHGAAGPTATLYAAVLLWLVAAAARRRCAPLGAGRTQARVGGVTASHRDLDGLAPSTYEATLSLNLGKGYPVGAFVPLAISSSLTPSASCTTARALPKNGSAEKTSTWLKFRMPAR